MRGVEQQHQLPLPEHAALHARMLRRVVGDGDVAFALVQRLEQVAVVQGLHVERDFRVLAPVLGDRRRHHVLAERGHHRQADMPTADVADVRDRLLQRQQAVVDVLDLDEQRVRLVGGDQPPAHQLEQLETQLVLGVVQDLADRWLGDVQRTCRGTDRAGGVDRVEDFNLAQAHGPILVDAGVAGDRSRRRHHCAIASATARSPLPIARVQPSMPWPRLHTSPAPMARISGEDQGVTGRRPAQSLSMCA